MDHKVISVEGLSVWFGPVCAVDDLSLAVRKGERLVVLGSTGAGKSTALNVVLGGLQPTSGTVSVLGLDPWAQWAELKGRVAIAFQSPRLLPWRTALGNVAIGLHILGTPRQERLERARGWLERVKLSDAASRYPWQLSGGMQQRVSLARALVVNPELLLLDEPFSALDEVTGEELRADFVRLCEETGVTVMMVTHDIEEALDVGTRVIVLSRPARVVGDFAIDEETRRNPDARMDMRHEIYRLLRSETGAQS